MRLSPLQALKKMVAVLSEQPCHFCLIGGHAASLYRSQERFTRDVDFAIVGIPRTSSRVIAENSIKQVGLRPMIGFIPAGPRESKRKGICLITSEPSESELTGLIDILLPELPWIPQAVDRAQSNLLDLGFAKVPVITPEDLIIAKCYALANAPDRFQDLDDLKCLFRDVTDLDSDYLKSRFAVLGLSIPGVLVSGVPEPLRMLVE